MPQTRLATSHWPTPAAGPVAETPCEPMAAATITSTMVPMISLAMLASGALMAGPVQNTPSLAAGSGVCAQCGAKWSVMSAAPDMAPSICADQRLRSWEYSPLATALAKEIAGLRCAPELPNAWATNIPQRTARPHPVATTIQPASAAYDLRKVTLALTPLPSRMSTRV